MDREMAASRVFSETCDPKKEGVCTKVVSLFTGVGEKGETDRRL